ncbi:MAG: hypothetical protein SF123_17440 [Chloroflexota bacterium]|nr:hypothetical protein [Chloroflexota bacterium]
MTDSDAAARIDRLMDAIDLIKADKREQARALLRELIRENGDFEDAWLWMSVAVDSLDQSAVCLDNVLRINPNNSGAAGALYRLRYSEMESERKRARLRFYRDLANGLFWFLVMALVLSFVCNIYSAVWYAMSLVSSTPTP